MILWSQNDMKMISCIVYLMYKEHVLYSVKSEATSGELIHQYYLLGVIKATSTTPSPLKKINHSLIETRKCCEKSSHHRLPLSFLQQIRSSPTNICFSVERSFVRSKPTCPVFFPLNSTFSQEAIPHQKMQKLILTLLR